ncbi:capsule polysaccharide biosynthesis protein [Diplocarpon rosae]|nr:capsule polysaccharide biosynthesis protein [Diplocarpon rosae]
MAIFGMNLVNFFSHAPEDQELDNRNPAGEPTRRETILSEINRGIVLRLSRLSRLGLSELPRCAVIHLPRDMLRHTEQITNYSTNSCADVCGRRGMCLHGRLTSCTLDCHAGPCLYTCADSCSERPLVAAVTPRAPSAVTRPSSSGNPGSELASRRSYVGLWAIYAVLYVLLGIALCFHVRWNTMPWRYPHVGADLWCLGGSGRFLLFGVLIFSGTMGKLMSNPVRYYAGPKIAWYLQMKDSCNGLDTRIDMDDGQRFQAISITHRHPPRNFYLAEHVVPSTVNSTAPFQYYHRLSGATGAVELAVDVDLQRQQWRLLRLSSADTVNCWLAYDSKFLSSSTSPGQIPFPRFASFATPHETLVHRGSFGSSGAHMWISGLGSGHEVEIFNMYAFVMQYKQEPFLRVFARPDTDARSSPASAPGSWHRRNPMWTQRPHALEHMRTAAFGYRRGDLTMCARAVEHPWHFGSWESAESRKDTEQDLYLDHSSLLV